MSTVATAPSSLHVSVLGAFGLGDRRHALPPVLGGSQRLLALLGLRDRTLMRASVAGTLWPESSEEHAYSSLRSALVRLNMMSRDAVVVTPIDLRLADGVTVDIRQGRFLAQQLLDPGTTSARMDLGAQAVASLSLDLLPGWYDDWAMLENEDWRRLRLQALEALSDRLLVAGRFGEATNAASAAVRVEPLRESARALVIRVHLAQGNQSEALGEYGRYRALLRSDLGLEPTMQLRDLVSDLQRR